MSANAETQTPQQPVKKSGKRKRLLLLLTLLFIIIAVAIGIYWFLVLRHFEETDDAYVAGNQIQIMSQVSGSVTKVWADNTDFVKEGDVLVTANSCRRILRCRKSPSQKHKATTTAVCRWAMPT